MALRRSGEDSSSVGGAAGNLKLCEKELEGFLVVGMCGVLGVVLMPGRRLPAGRGGRANSLELSLAGEGDNVPPTRGEGCVAERWPGELTG